MQLPFEYQAKGVSEYVSLAMDSANRQLYGTTFLWSPKH